MSIILLTCTIILLLISSIYIILEYYADKESIRKSIATTGIIVASNSSAAVAFQSPQDAEEILQALKANKNIVSACIFDKSNNIFAKYPDSIPNKEFPSKPIKKGYYFEDNFLINFEPIVQQDFELGTLYIKTDLHFLYNQMRIKVLIALSLMAISLAIAFLLSYYLQKKISGPIVALEKTAKIISKDNDYSVRAIKASDDEIGSFTDAFNQMLHQIEVQNQQIISANEESLKLAAIVESSGDAIIGTSLDLNITSWNRSAEKLLGYTADEMIGISAVRILPENQQSKCLAVLEKLKDGSQEGSFETQFLTKDRQLVDISLAISLIKNSDGTIVGISKIARDISLQKQHERLIIENEEHLRLATQAAELGTFDTNLATGSINLDVRCRELLGLDAETAEIDYKSIYLNLHADDKKRIKSIIKSIATGIDLDSYDIEFRTVGQDKKVRWIRARGKILINEHQKPLRFIGAILDITNSKNEELRKNDFIAIISHELKTPLTTIRAYIQLLLRKALQENDNYRISALTKTESQAKKMITMIHSFLSLARIEDGKLHLLKEKFSLTTLIDEIVNDAILLNPSNKIVIENTADISIYADKDKIGQVLTNLISNACKYSSLNSTVTISCEKSNRKVKVCVKDEGIGISPKDQKKLFTRFYRVEHEQKKTVSGFGIGLFLVAEILHYHHSKIELDSIEGVGSTFHFTIDLA